jgi:hypothetical protein
MKKFLPYLPSPSLANLGFMFSALLMRPSYYVLGGLLIAAFVYGLDELIKAAFKRAAKEEEENREYRLVLQQRVASLEEKLTAFESLKTQVARIGNKVGITG